MTLIVLSLGLEIWFEPDGSHCAANIDWDDGWLVSVIDDLTSMALDSRLCPQPHSILSCKACR